MLKQKKNYLKKTSKVNKKIFYRFRKLFSNKHSILNQNLNFLVKTPPKFFIKIKFTQNNIFLTYSKIENNNTLKVFSTGKEKIKTSKKLLKFSTKIFFPSVFEKISEDIKNKILIINIICPNYLKSNLIKTISKFLQFNIFILNIKNNKCFNGCKVKKQKRKKRKMFRIFK